MGQHVTVTLKLNAINSLFNSERSWRWVRKCFHNLEGVVSWRREALWSLSPSCGVLQVGKRSDREQPNKKCEL